MRETKKTQPRTIIFDIEATGLNCTFGTILAIGWKFLGEDKVFCPTILDYSKGNLLDDKGLVEKFASVYETADQSVAHFGKWYDLPMIQGKLLKHNLKPLAPIPLIDTWRVAKDNFKFHNNRLATIEDFLGVKKETGHGKTKIDFDAWLQAAHGNKRALKEVVDHCKEDVLVLEACYLKMKPWIKEPVRRLFVDEDEQSCISCGSTKLQRRGYQVTLTRKYPRVQCLSCGKWQRHNTKEELVA